MIRINGERRERMYDGFDFEAYLTEGIARLTGYCAAIVGRGDAEDAAQEAYLSLWRRLDRIPNEAAAGVYLYRAAYHIAVDMLRRRKRFPIPEMPPDAPDTVSPEMLEALGKLRPEDRAILYGRVVDECGYGELAARFGKNEAWARKRYSLARKKLAKLLSEKRRD